MNIHFSVPPTLYDHATLLIASKTKLPEDWNARITVTTSLQTFSRSIGNGDLVSANYLEKEGLEANIINNAKVPLQSGRPTEVWLEFASPQHLEDLSLWITYLKESF